MTVAMILSLAFIGIFVGLVLIATSGPGQKFNIMDYANAEKTIDSFKERAFGVCRVFSNEYSDSNGRDIWAGCIGFEYANAMGDMQFDIDKAAIAELDTIRVSFDLGYETYDGEAFMQVQFPFAFLNLSDDELRSGYKLVQCGKKKTDKVFKIVEKEIENAD